MGVVGGWVWWVGGCGEKESGGWVGEGMRCSGCV